MYNQQYGISQMDNGVQ